MGISHGDLALADKVRDYMAKNPDASGFKVRAKFGLSEGRLKRLRDNGVILDLPKDKAVPK